jgi:hypothetical protein
VELKAPVASSWAAAVSCSRLGVGGGRDSLMVKKEKKRKRSDMRRERGKDGKWTMTQVWYSCPGSTRVSGGWHACSSTT